MSLFPPTFNNSFKPSSVSRPISHFRQPNTDIFANVQISTSNNYGGSFTPVSKYSPSHNIQFLNETQMGKELQSKKLLISNNNGQTTDSKFKPLIPNLLLSTTNINNFNNNLNECLENRNPFARDCPSVISKNSDLMNDDKENSSKMIKFHPLKPSLNITESKTRLRCFNKGVNSASVSCQSKFSTHSTLTGIDKLNRDLLSGSNSVRSTFTFTNLSSNNLIPEESDNEGQKEQENDSNCIDPKYKEQYNQYCKVPFERKDDEVYKICQIHRNLKRKTLPFSSSTRKSEYNSHGSVDEEESSMFSLLGKRKKIQSYQKKYSGQISLLRPDGHLQQFKVFRDEEIGIVPFWQAHITPSTQDDDVPTDEEDLKRSTIFVQLDLQNAMELIINQNQTSLVENAEKMNITTFKK